MSEYPKLWLLSRVVQPEAYSNDDFEPYNEPQSIHPTKERAVEWLQDRVNDFNSTPAISAVYQLRLPTDPNSGTYVMENRFKNDPTDTWPYVTIYDISSIDFIE